jgi:hypothetical protein
MPDIKWIDAREFREAGFLQEANRQFFHPHGLALAVTSVTDDEGAPIHTFALTAEQHSTLRDILKAVRETADSVGEWSDNTLGALLGAIEGAARYDVGDSYFQGVWDYRDDPEGVIFGSWPERDREKVERVAVEREKHRSARAEMFGADTDVEPIGWEAPPDA